MQDGLADSVTEALDSRMFSDFCGSGSSNQAPDGMHGGFAPDLRAVKR